MGRVIFIGAGPGAADLMTLRGARLLALADVVLFDALTDPALRELAPRARWIDVGKWHPPSATGIGDWELLGKNLSERLILPNPGTSIRLTTRGTIRYLHEGSRGRPGLAVEWAKRAASYAVWHDVDLDATALAATLAEPSFGEAP